MLPGVTKKDPLSDTTTYTYNGADQLLTETDPLGNETEDTYNTADELYTVAATNSSYSLTTERTLLYDAAGNLTSEANSLSQATTYGNYALYDGKYLPGYQKDPAGHTTSYTYDGQGNLATLVDPQSRTTTYAYDPVSRVNSITYSDGVTPNVSYTYDLNGERHTMTDGSGTTTWNYNNLDQLKSDTNGYGQTTSYVHDGVGNVTKITYPTSPSGATQSY